MKHSMIAAMLVAAGLSGAAVALPATATAPVADATRPAEDRARDAERKPAEMLAFAGVRPGAVVVDVLPGGGYFTRLFSSAVRPGGRVIAFLPDETLAKSQRGLDRINAVAAEPGRNNISVEHRALSAPMPEGVADIVWTAQNYHDLHNMAGVDVMAFNRQVLRVLKPGGVYIVVDHAAKAGTGLANTADLHRIDPLIVRQEVEAAGFVFDGESKALANPADPKTTAVFDPAVRGHTDQFVFRFRKPKGK